MEKTQMKCPKCDVALKPGIVLAGHKEYGIRYCFSDPKGDGSTMKTMKCPKCGHSERAVGESLS